MDRRTFIAGALATVVLPGADSGAPIRAVTRAPGFHWFGYYDKLQFSPDSRYLLGMRVDFEHRSPRAEDQIELGMVDLTDHDRWLTLGHTRAWNWQQGAMLQWIPGSRDEVIWNDRREGQFVSVIHNIHSGRERVIPAPIYSLRPDGKSAIYPDFARLNDCRPGYGYAGLPDPRAGVAAPDHAGLWQVDLTTGKSRLLISFRDAEQIPYPQGYSRRAKHWFNHLLYRPDGERFIFLHRWRGDQEGKSFSTRMFTADRNGGNLYVLDPSGKTSHFIWRDPKTVLAWTWHASGGDGFYLFHDQTDQVEQAGKGVMTVNGHCTYLPGNRYILNDTYPDRQRLQNVYLYRVADGTRIPLASLFAPPEYQGEWRCDTHPRYSPDGNLVCVDSAHAGGRQMYLIEIRKLIS